MAEITDVTVVDGQLPVNGPAIILTAQAAMQALDDGELDDLIRKALSGRQLILLEAA